MSLAVASPSHGGGQRFESASAYHFNSLRRCRYAKQSGVSKIIAVAADLELVYCPRCRQCWIQQMVFSDPLTVGVAAPTL